MKAAICPACGNALITDIRPWHLVCENCHYEGSDLEPHIEGRAGSAGLDEVAREQALSTLRQRNFPSIVDQICSMLHANRPGPRLRLLDVGCAHGWFMQACGATFDVVGIEPDGAVAEEARKRTGPIRQGFFPDVLKAEEKFDVIVFNDVLEHIPDVISTMKACNQHLAAGGLLVINAPCRLGSIYRTSKFMARRGWPRSFERMWQLGFPSPHLHYFDTGSIRRLGNAAAFRIEKQTRLPSVVSGGLYSRIRYSKQISRTKAALIASAVFLSIPALKLLPSDIEVWYLRKINES